jgi:hypothetical protein
MILRRQVLSLYVFWYCTHPEIGIHTLVELAVEQDEDVLMA